jgi:hypothetical protein
MKNWKNNGENSFLMIFILIALVILLLMEFLRSRSNLDHSSEQLLTLGLSSLTTLIAAIIGFTFGRDSEIP